MPYSKEALSILHEAESSSDPEERLRCLDILRDMPFNQKYRADESEMADQIADLFNKLGTDYNKVATALTRQHRTLQQSFTSFCFLWIRTMGAQEYVDGRNEAARDHCRRITVILHGAGEYLDRLPFV